MGGGDPSIALTGIGGLHLSDEVMTAIRLLNLEIGGCWNIMRRNF
jgi:hypothetical protein